MADDVIVSYAIHPGIGIARVGNSPDQFYIAPELPGHAPFPPYKDDQGRVKRQAARFRVFGLNQAGEAVKEITAADAAIEWRVHLANRKAAWYQFNNPMDLGDFGLECTFRNHKLVGDDRQTLAIDPGCRSISGVSQSGPAFDTGTFMGQPVYLGELRTDEAGRLLVFGGRGVSAPGNPALGPATTFANNDGWHDDVSDGPVRATITVGGQNYEAEPATVVVAAPNFAPGIYSVVTMYDVAVDLFTRMNWIPPVQVTFDRHIFPLFERLVNLQWVNQGFYFLFGANSPAEYTRKDFLEKLSDPSPGAADARRQVFAWFRRPDNTSPEPAKIPPLYGDGHGDFPNGPAQFLSLTPTQYDILERWAYGDFVNDRSDLTPTPATLQDLPVASQPDALDHAALEECLGGPFHPGIEMTWIVRQACLWKRPFRLNVAAENEQVRDDWGPILTPPICLGRGGPLSSCGPGAITRWMGVPWQTDEASCLSGYDASNYLPLPSYWPARVPNQVLPLAAYNGTLDPTLTGPQRMKHFDNRQFWMRDLGSDYQTRINNMVTSWDSIGIITRRPGPSDGASLGLPVEMWVEEGRAASYEAHDPSVHQLFRSQDPAAADAQSPSADEQLAKELSPAVAMRVAGRSER